MESSSGAIDDNWLRDFVAGAFDDVNHAGSLAGATPPPPAWLVLIDRASPAETIGPVGP